MKMRSAYVALMSSFDDFKFESDHVSARKMCR